jgi:hypothetical protein
LPFRMLEGQGADRNWKDPVPGHSLVLVFWWLGGGGPFWARNLSRSGGLTYAHRRVHTPLKAFWRMHFIFMLYVYSCAPMHVYYILIWCPWTPKEGTRSPGTEVTGGYEMLCRCWNRTRVPCKRTSSLTSEPTLFSPLLKHCKANLLHCIILTINLSGCCWKGGGL